MKMQIKQLNRFSKSKKSYVSVASNVSRNGKSRTIYKRLVVPLLFNSRLGRKVLFGKLGEGTFADYIYSMNGVGYTFFGGFVEKVLRSLPSVKATRQKAITVMEILKNEIHRNKSNQKTTKVIDIGSGPARYLVALRRKIDFEAICFDINSASISLGRRISESNSIEYRFGNLLRMERYRTLSKKIGWRANVAVVSTCYDFIDDGGVRGSLEEIFRSLEPGGMLLVVFQQSNPSRHLIDAVGGAYKKSITTAVYRKPETVKRWLIAAGFKDVEYSSDRWGMYVFCTGRKVGLSTISRKPPTIFMKSILYTRASEQRRSNSYQYMRGYDEVMYHQNKSKNVINESRILLASNDYLGMRNRSEVITAAKDALDMYGVSTTSSRILTGNFDVHERLQGKLAEFLGVQDSLVFSTGYMANIGTVSQLLGEGDTVILDRRVHASLLDGCRLSKATPRFFVHNSVADLRRILQEIGPGAPNLIICDGVYSMDGDIAPLPEIFDLAEKYGSAVVVDDGHGTGVFGKCGRGVLEYYNINIEGKGCIIVGSLAKAIGSVGGFVAGDHVIIDHIRHTARPMLFSTSLAPSSAVAATVALEILINEPDLLVRLWSNARQMKAGLLSLGLNIGLSESPIIPIIIGDEYKVYKMVLALEEKGIVVDGIGPPGVKSKSSRIRLRVSASHTESEINYAVEQIGIICKEMGVFR